MDRLDGQMNRQKRQMDDYADHWLLKYIPVIINAIVAIFIVAGAWFMMPQKIMADVDTCYVRKDVHAVMQTDIENQLIEIKGLLKEVLRRDKYGQN